MERNKLRHLASGLVFNSPAKSLEGYISEKMKRLNDYCQKPSSKQGYINMLNADIRQLQSILEQIQTIDNFVLHQNLSMRIQETLRQDNSIEALAVIIADSEDYDRTRMGYLTPLYRDSHV